MYKPLITTTTYANSKLKNNISLWFGKYFYPLFTSFTKDHGVVFLNYGYQDEEFDETPLPLDKKDERFRYNIQLYHHLASHIDMKGKDVLEVSSGHGGGASYISRYLQPRSYVGLDKNAKAIEFCKHCHKVQGLSFVLGDASNIHLDDASVDAVVNVEASQHYPDRQKFLEGVSRVLRPQGHFLTTTLHPIEKVDEWREQLRSTGMKIMKETDITTNVIKAMEKLDQHYLKMLNGNLNNKLLKFIFKEFAGVKDSIVYNHLVKRNLLYLTFALQKV